MPNLDRNSNSSTVVWCMGPAVSPCIPLYLTCWLIRNGVLHYQILSVPGVGSRGLPHSHLHLHQAPPHASSTTTYSIQFSCSIVRIVGLGSDPKFFLQKSTGTWRKICSQNVTVDYPFFSRKKEMHIQKIGIFVLLDNKIKLIQIREKYLGSTEHCLSYQEKSFTPCMVHNWLCCGCSGFLLQRKVLPNQADCVNQPCNQPPQLINKAVILLIGQEGKYQSKRSRKSGMETS